MRRHCLDYNKGSKKGVTHSKLRELYQGNFIKIQNVFSVHEDKTFQMDTGGKLMQWKEQ